MWRDTRDMDIGKGHSGKEQPSGINIQRRPSLMGFSSSLLPSLSLTFITFAICTTFPAILMASTCFQRKTDSPPSTSLSSRHPALPDVYSPKGGEISDSDDADVDDLPSFKEILAGSSTTGDWSDH
jgi:hypothetical protein